MIDKLTGCPMMQLGSSTDIPAELGDVFVMVDIIGLQQVRRQSPALGDAILRSTADRLRR